MIGRQQVLTVENDSKVHSDPKTEGSINASNEVPSISPHPEQKISLDEALRYATEAKAYAQSQIIKGSTQIQNNVLSEEHFTSLRKGIGESEFAGGIREERNIRLRQDQLEKNIFVAFYESNIRVTSKYSLGNCQELSFQALDYILNKVPSNINAEVYHFLNGDHNFLVLNRDPNSNPSDPTTWGDAAVICDPWSDQVYKASDYLSNLKDFYRNNRNKNCVMDIDPKKHILGPMHPYNTNYLRSNRSIDNLKAAFLDESMKIIYALHNYKNEINTEKRSLIAKYGDNDQIVLNISGKIKQINELILNINMMVNNCLKDEYKNDYRFAKSQLMESLESCNSKATFVMQISKPQPMLGDKKKNITIKRMKFFDIKSKVIGLKDRPIFQYKVGPTNRSLTVQDSILLFFYNLYAFCIFGLLPVPYSSGISLAQKKQMPLPVKRIC